MYYAPSALALIGCKLATRAGLAMAADPAMPKAGAIDALEMARIGREQATKYRAALMSGQPLGAQFITLR